LLLGYAPVRICMYRPVKNRYRFRDEFMWKRKCHNWIWWRNLYYLDRNATACNYMAAKLQWCQSTYALLCITNQVHLSFSERQRRGSIGSAQRSCIQETHREMR